MCFQSRDFTQTAKIPNGKGRSLKCTAVDTTHSKETQPWLMPRAKTNSNAVKAEESVWNCKATGRKGGGRTWK